MSGIESAQRALTLKDIHCGSIDGRFEFLPSDNDDFDKVFYQPTFISDELFDQRAKYFVYGMRGAGKTSILRWICEKKRSAGHICEFILFKSEITENERSEISTGSSFSVAQTDRGKMEFSQDFKDAWRWFLHHRIGEIVFEKYNTNQASKQYVATLGLDGNVLIEKTSGWMPKIKNANVKLKGSLGGLSAEVKGDIGTSQEVDVSFSTLNKALLKALKDIDFGNTLYLFIDELEVFRSSDEQYDRDRRFVRDLLFTITQFNEFFSAEKIPIVIAAAVRSEIMQTLGPLGQEIQRVVKDRGISVDWEHYKVNLQHPFINMIRKKLAFSEIALHGDQYSLDGVGDIFVKYFDQTVDTVAVENFLLDRSFFRPRDIVYRLNTAKELNPEATRFSREALEATEKKYSAWLWSEISYGLSAKYNADEIGVLESLFAGKESFFTRAIWRTG